MKQFINKNNIFSAKKVLEDKEVLLLVRLLHQDLGVDQLRVIG